MWVSTSERQFKKCDFALVIHGFVLVDWEEKGISPMTNTLQ
jgi:hypothetical protein